VLLGLITFGAALAEWFNVGFGALTRGSAIRFVIASSTTLVLGAQILYGSFFLHLLDYRATCSTKDQVHPGDRTASRVARKRKGRRYGYP
jgi:hypothetical protein